MTTDRLLDLAYDAQDVVELLRELHDPRVKPGTYARALIAALRELDGSAEQPRPA